MHYARNGDVRLAYRVFGDGDIPLVWAPGWFSNVAQYAVIPIIGSTKPQLS